MTTWNVPRAGRLGAISILIIALLALSLVQPASADSAKKLRFDAAPSTTVAGQIVPTVRVNVLDQQDRVVSDSTAEVTVALSSGGTLYGDNVENADGGVASFSTLRVIPAGSYTLTATSPGLLPDAASLVITGAGTVCTSNGCPTLNDPNGATPTGSNSTTGTLKISSCPGAGTNTDFASYDEATATFCDGACLGAGVFFASDCTGTDPWFIVYRLDKSILRTAKGAVKIQLFIEATDGSGTPIPDCVKAGILNPGPICVSRQYKSGQGDSISEVLKEPGDPKIAGRCIAGC